MKKIFTLFAAMAATAAINAATVNWSVGDLTGLANNDLLNGQTFEINGNLSVSFSNGEQTNSNNFVKYRKVTAMPSPGIALYSQNTMTITATDATITSVTFNVLSDDADAGSDNTPGWKIKVGSTTYSVDNTTWTGSESTVVALGNSKSTILGLTIEYTGGSDTPAEPGQEGNVNWLATELTTLANNDQLDGMSFNINNEISFSLADNDSDKDIIYKKTSSAPTTINIYSKGSITFQGAEGVVITSIKFIVNTTEGTSNTPGWNLQTADKTSYTADNDTWTGAENEITFTDKSAVQLMGVNISYTAPTGVESIASINFENVPAYDLSGRQVDENYKGIVIQGGKKILRR